MGVAPSETIKEYAEKPAIVGNPYNLPTEAEENAVPTPEEMASKAKEAVLSEAAPAAAPVPAAVEEEHIEPHHNS